MEDYTLFIRVIRNFLGEAERASINSYVRQKYKRFLVLNSLGYAAAAAPEWNSSSKRYGIHNDPFLREVHQTLTPVFSEIIGKQVKSSYVFLALYSDEGIVDPHYDRPQCEYTLDYCLSQTKPWPIVIEGTEYLLDENDAVVYSGTKHLHSRQKIDKNNYCNMIFFHFVDEEYAGSLD